MYLKWQEYQLEVHDKEDFAGIPDTEPKNGIRVVERKIIASEFDVFKHYTSLGVDDTTIEINGSSVNVTCWPTRMSNKINNKLKGLNSDR